MNTRKRSVNQIIAFVLNKMLLVFLLGCTVIGLVCVVFASIETYVYYQNDDSHTGPEAHLKKELVPYLFLQPEPNTEMSVPDPQIDGKGKTGIAFINRHRFRYGELNKTKPENTTRIFMLGGSVVFNGGSNDTTIAGFLETRLDKNAQTLNRDVQVVNAGMTGYVSTQELILLMTQVVDFNPDIAIVIDGFNDCLVPFIMDKRLGYPYGFQSLEEAWYHSTEILESLRQLPLYSHIRYGSHVLRDLYPDWTYTQALKTQRTEEEADPVVEQATVEKAADLFLANWQKMAQVMQANQIDGLFIMQPMQYEFGWYTPFYNRVESKMEILREEFPNFVFQSYRTFLRDRPELFYDQVHTFEEGNQLFAQRLHEELQQHKAW